MEGRRFCFVSRLLEIAKVALYYIYEVVGFFSMRISLCVRLVLFWFCFLALLERD